MLDNKEKSQYKQEYNKKHYKQLKVDIKPEDFQLIDDYCKESGISKASLIVEACKAWIDTH